MRIKMGYEPNGTEFYDVRSGRSMKLVSDGPYAGWIVYRHPDGQWVTLRQVTDADRAAIKQAAERVPTVRIEP